MDWCQRVCAACSEVGKFPVEGCPYDSGCDTNILLWHEMGDHRRCNPKDCELVREFYGEVKAYGMAAATPDEVAIVSCADGTIQVHGTYSPNKARHARTAIGKSLGLPVTVSPNGQRSWEVIKGQVLVVCKDGHVT